MLMRPDAIFFIFILGSVLGFFIETIYCFLATKRLESRRGMLYGPFTQIYGFGAVLMSVLLTPIAQQSFLLLFIASGLLGGFFEALCSFMQERVFGTVSWDYSKHRTALFGGRTSLLFMLYWSVLGSAYVTLIQPQILSLYEGIPENVKAFGHILLFAFLAVDVLLSCMAWLRWNERKKGVQGPRIFAKALDQRFPDERLEKLFPSIKFMSKKAEG